MRILVFSDSHGYTYNMSKAINKNKNIDLIIHLGDLVKDAIKVREQYKNIGFEFVAGNNDWSNEYLLEKTLELEGKRIFITHGHQYNVKYDYQRLIRRGQAINADAVLFGHTHINEEMFSEGMLLLNPGSISAPIEGNRPTYSLIEIKEGRILSRFYSID